MICQSVRCEAADGGGLKRVHTIAWVRWAFYVQGWSLEKIVRDLHVSRSEARPLRLIFGPASSTRPRIIFCMFPPERSRTRA